MSDSLVITSPAATVQKATKPKMLDLICKAIEVTSVPRKGSSYVSIRHWVIENMGTEMKSTRLTASLKRAFDEGLKQEVLCRTNKCKDNVGLTGWFLLVKKQSPQELKKELARKRVKSIDNGKSTAKSEVAKKANAVAKSKAVATKGAPAAAKSKAVATKSAPAVAKSKAVATKSAPTRTKTKVAASRSAPAKAKSKIAANKSALTKAKSKVASAKSAPTLAKSKIATATIAPIETENVATESDSSEHSNDDKMVTSTPIVTKSEVDATMSPERTQNIEASPETSEPTPKNVHKATKAKPGIKTTKSKFPGDTKVKKLYTSDEELTSDNLPRKDLSDTELEVKRIERKSLKSYSSDTDINIAAKEMNSKQAKQKRKPQKHTKGKF